MEWPEVLKRDPICLNLGGGNNCHPRADYRDYISVDLKPRRNRYAVHHDLRDPFRIPDDAVARILSEDSAEHLKPDALKKLFAECHRVLKPGGSMRVGCPDYLNPKDRFCLGLGHDPRWPLHVTITTYESMKEIVEDSPFQRHKFYHYWVGDEHIEEKIGYSLGMVERTPDNDPCNWRTGWWQNWRGRVADEKWKKERNGKHSEVEFLATRGHRYHVTSLVFDLFKD